MGSGLDPLPHRQVLPWVASNERYRTVIQIWNPTEDAQTLVLQARTHNGGDSLETTFQAGACEMVEDIFDIHEPAYLVLPHQALRFLGYRPCPQKITP